MKLLDAWELPEMSDYLFVIPVTTILVSNQTEYARTTTSTRYVKEMKKM